MEKNKAFGFIILLFIAVVLMISCEEEEELPESGILSGTVSFIGTWPDTGTVFLSIQNDWPPTGAPYALEVITEESVTNNQYTFSFTDVAFGTYGALAVSWEDPNDDNPATNQHILGAYGATAKAYFMDADSIAVSAENAEHTGLDFQADLALAVGVGL